MGVDNSADVYYPFQVFTFRGFPFPVELFFLGRPDFVFYTKVRHYHELI